MVKKISLKGGGGQTSNINTMFMILVIVLLSWVIYLLCKTYNTNNRMENPKERINIINNIERNGNDLHMPPLKNDNSYYYGSQARGYGNDINVRTRGHLTEYSQIGLLTKDEVDKHPIILPLFGRRVDRNKMQYYAISNTGSMNTKLPVKKNGRSCTEERGCDELFSGDDIFVEGYKASFKSTIYENSNDFAYIA
jgi:hypothetical protein